MNTSPLTEDPLRELQRELVESLSGTMDRVTDDWHRLLEAGWEAELASGLVRLVHNLRGEAASFGLTRLLPQARELESALKEAVGTSEPDAAGREDVDSKLRQLRQACGLYCPENLPDLPVELTSAQPGETSVSRELIFLVEDDEKQSHLLEQQLRQYDFEVECFTNLEQLEERLKVRRPSVLLMDIILPEGKLAGVEFISKLRRQGGPRLPVVFLSVRDDMVARLHACRAAGNGYFTKPPSFSLLAERLDQLTGRQPVRPLEILIVDDDLRQAAYYAQALRHAGMLVSTMDDPMAVLGHLEHSRPDLMLLDLYMPGCSGPELAAVLRQHESYLSMPIVFLSSEEDFDQQLEALGLGGDEFLTKPIDPSHLVATVRPRAERGRALGTRLHRDGLTGLMTHSGQKAQLELELTRADREGQEVSFAMLDLDDFKSVNDTYGHGAGDRVLCGVAGVLKKRLRCTDLIARYGGDEFAVALPNTRVEDARRILQEVTERFSRLVHTADGQRFTSTLSCGIASFPQSPDALQLTRAADRALYRAKREGRNRVIVSGWTEERGATPGSPDQVHIS